MSHQNGKRARDGVWTMAGLVFWTVLVIAVLAVVTGCGPAPAQGREGVHGFMSTHPELGHMP